MKLVKATISLNGENKTVKVMLDDETYALLQETGDEELTASYIAEEYAWKKTERKETRRHVSYEGMMERGVDYADKRENPLESLLRSEGIRDLKRALSTLTERQRIAVLYHVLERQSFREIGDKFGINKETVREHYNSGIKKLRKFFAKHPFKP